MAPVYVFPSRRNISSELTSVNNLSDVNLDRGPFENGECIEDMINRQLTVGLFPVTCMGVFTFGVVLGNYLSQCISNKVLDYFL